MKLNSHALFVALEFGLLMCLFNFRIAVNFALLAFQCFIASRSKCRCKWDHVSYRIQFSVLRSKHALIEIQLKVDRSLETRLVRPVLHNCIKTDTPHELKLNLFLDDDVELILFTIFQNSITVSKQ